MRDSVRAEGRTVMWRNQNESGAHGNLDGRMDFEPGGRSS